MRACVRACVQLRAGLRGGAGGHAPALVLLRPVRPGHAPPARRAFAGARRGRWRHHHEAARASVRACVRECVRACVRLSASVCETVRARASVCVRVYI